MVRTPTPVPAYRAAIDQTIRTIERRARYFRNQVVIIVSIGALVTTAALVGRSPDALWALLVLVPACGLFFYVDDRALKQWRSALLAAWTAHAVDFAAFCQAIRANPALPKGTTEGMLMTLPSCGDLVAEQKVSTPTRQAIVAVCIALDRDRADRLLLDVIATAIAVGTLLAALWLRTWTPVLSMITLVALPVVRGWTAKRGRERCEAEVAACRGQAGFDDSDYTRIRAQLR